MLALRNVTDVREALGREIGPGEWMIVDQDRVDGFAEDTGDHQWIHVDPVRAAAGPFGTTVAHGFLTLSLVPVLANGIRRFEGATAVNYGLEKVRFPSPVPVGSRLRARLVIASADDLPDGGLQLLTRVTVELQHVVKPACVAELLTRISFE
ncbi:MaoC family dehydratase [Actinomycetospora aeridis]|uniref:MaoC family dehydratase n=1 Tax=Actinomycetospora aeridis TaxID=3129231 RepID=A0ABU8ND69_9PSEU